MERWICLAVGYMFGLLQTSYFMGKRSNIDIRSQGSGNAGTTNALRVMGWKAGVITFFGDALKGTAAVLVVCLMYKGSDCLPLLGMYAGAGVTLGHNFPFYMGFKGGKGIAVMAGLVLANSFWHLPVSLLLLPISIACFLTPVLVTKYISLGSLVAYAAFLAEIIVIGQMGWLDMEKGYLYELYVIVFLMTALAYYRHRANIGRLIAGTENKFKVKKKE